MFEKKKILFEKNFILVFLLWLFVYSWRPLFLGFYHDDWSMLVESTNYGAPFSLIRLKWFMAGFTSRPFSGLLYYLFSSSFGRSPFIWQVGQAIIVLIAAIALRSFLKSLFKFLKIKTIWILDLAVSLWLVFPWTMGTTAWPTSGTPLFSLIFFALAGKRLFSNLQKGKIPGFFTNLLFLSSYLVYEAFYFQYLVLISFAFLIRLQKHFQWKLITIPLITLTLSQTAVIVWNRLSPRFLPGFTKTFYKNWLALFLDSFRKLPKGLFKSAAELKIPLKIIVLVLVVCFFIYFCKTLLKKGFTKSFLLISPIFLSLVGIILSVLIYSLAGYGIETIGLFSRTNLSLSFWLAITIALFYGLMYENLPLLFKKIASLATISLLFCFISATFLRTQEWAAAWKIQKQILASAPIEQISKTDPAAAIIFVGPYIYKGIHLFIASWDISAAMNNTYPQLRLPNVAAEKWRGGRLFTVQRDWLTSWDGKLLTQRNLPKDQPPIWRLEASEVWLWKYDSQEFIKMEEPFVIGEKI